MISLFWLMSIASLAMSGETAPYVAHLDLPVVEISERYPPYGDFCRRQPQQCRLIGADSLRYDQALMNQLRRVSATVNKTVKFALDRDIYAVEDYWTLPNSGFGDCEDMALEKRSQLAQLGHSAGALRLAFVFHREDMSSHCVLTVETTHGTFLLDSNSDDVNLWSETPYNFEARERQDGRWDRYDQSGWRYGEKAATHP